MSIETRLDFIDKELNWWSAYANERLRKEIKKRGIVVTRLLLLSLSRQVNTKVSQSMGTARLIFDTAGRFVDMGAGSGYHKGVPTSENIKAKLMGTERRKPVKWYSKTAYGTIGRLMYNFSAKYSEAVTQGIKETLLYNFNK